MNSSVPKKLFFTKGVGTHKEELHSFELALRDAGMKSVILYRYPVFSRRAVKLFPKRRG